MNSGCRLYSVTCQLIKRRIDTHKVNDIKIRCVGTTGFFGSSKKQRYGCTRDNRAMLQCDHVIKQLLKFQLIKKKKKQFVVCLLYY